MTKQPEQPTPNEAPHDTYFDLMMEGTDDPEYATRMHELASQQTPWLDTHRKTHPE